MCGAAGSGVVWGSCGARTGDRAPRTTSRRSSTSCTHCRRRSSSPGGRSARRGPGRGAAPRTPAVSTPPAVPPSCGWAANLLRRSRPDEAERFLELGSALREAYATLDPSGLKELSAQRRRIVSEMSRQAAALAREAGHPLSDAVQRDVETTLRAVLADPQAATVWEAGRVEGVLTPPSEFGADAVAAAAGPSRVHARPDVP